MPTCVCLLVVKKPTFTYSGRSVTLWCVAARTPVLTKIGTVMSPQTFRTINRDDQKAHSVTRSPARANTVLWHEMTVIASSVTDVVASAGGWLFDRRMAGWKVDVLVADRVGERPLQILARTRSI